jgi:hypothetical protein
MFRKQALFAFLLLLASVTLWSCKKDSEPTPAPAVPASMECKVNNVSWKAATFNNTLVTMQTERVLRETARHPGHGRGRHHDHPEPQ